MATKTYNGSCHCGAVRFTAQIDLTAGTAKCNCTYCRKVRAWKAFVKPHAFKVTNDADVFGEYRTRKEAPIKYACSRCRVITHEVGDAEWAGGPFVGVFLGTLNDATPDELAAAPVRVFNGADDDFDSAPRVTSYL